MNRPTDRMTDRHNWKIIFTTPLAGGSKEDMTEIWNLYGYLVSWHMLQIIIRILEVIYSKNKRIFLLSYIFKTYKVVTNMISRRATCTNMKPSFYSLKNKLQETPLWFHCTRRKHQNPGVKTVMFSSNLWILN